MQTIQPFLSRRFLKFCSVGASGVVVNLGAMWVLLELLGVHTNISSAAAIELSIFSNFALNEIWTFGDHEASTSLRRRAARFHVVSLVGAALQWTVFVAANVGWLALVAEPGAMGEYLAGDSGFWARYVVRPILDPPDVGHLTYVSQLVGIGVATGWNFIANFHWTWRRH